MMLKLKYEELQKEHLSDFQIRHYFPWMLLFLFAFEGVTGMMPAIYTDVDEGGQR